MTSNEIIQIEDRLEQLPKLNLSGEREQFGSMIAFKNENPEQVRNEMDYMSAMMGIKRYVRVLNQNEGLNVCQVIDRFLERFNHRKDLIGAFQTFYQTNVCSLVQRGDINEEQAVSYSNKLETLLTK